MRNTRCIAQLFGFEYWENTVSLVICDSINLLRNSAKLLNLNAGDGNRTHTLLAEPRILSPFQNLGILRQLRLIAAYQQFSFGFPLINFRYFRANSL